MLTMREILHFYLRDMQEKTGEIPAVIALTRKQRNQLTAEAAKYAHSSEKDNAVVDLIRFEGVPVIVVEV